MAIEHKPLIEYLPQFLQEYREYQELFRVLWDEISEDENSILDRTDKALKDTYISEADANGIAKWERMLGIVPNAEETLDERRENIRSKMAGRRPFTYRKLQEILDDLVGPGEYTIAMTDTFILTVKVALTSKYVRGSAETLIRKVAPANIELVMSLMYRQQQDLFQYTHAQLSAYTHDDLREGAIS